MTSTSFWRDPNHVPAAGALKDDGSKDVEPIQMDSTTKRVKVTATTTDLIGTQTRAVDSVTVDNTVGGTEIVTADATIKSFIIYNNGANTVYLGPTGVSAADGLPLTAGSSFRESNINIALFGITSAGDADVRIMTIVEV